jgi:hypothetical protein
MNRPFDEFVFVDYCSDPNAFACLLEVEERYQFSASQCAAYREALDKAAGFSNSEDQNADCNSDWRYRIARWLLKAADELNINRETALIALMYCDRFMMSRKIDKQLYQIASATSLWVASKLYEKKPLKMAALVSYTQNRWGKEELIAIEEEILSSNQCLMYPPTPGTFVLLLLNGMSGQSDSLKAIIENSQFLTELASCDFFFLQYKPSTIALAAIFVALKQDDANIPPEIISSWLESVKAKGLDLENNDTKDCVERLRRIFNANQLHITMIETKPPSRNAKAPDSSGRVTPSPRESVTISSGSKRKCNEMSR